MKHDSECENGSTIVMWDTELPRVGCRWAERAYAKDPYPGAPLPAGIALHDTPDNRISEREFTYGQYSFPDDV